MPGDIAGESMCSLGPTFIEKGACVWPAELGVRIGGGAAGFGEFLGGVFSPPSSSSSMGGQ